MALGEKPTAKEQAEAEEMRIGWRMAGLGMQVASEVAAGVLLGWLYDYWRGTGRIGVTIGAITGLAVAMWSLLRGTLKLNRELERVAPTKGRGKPIPFKKDQNENKPSDRDDWNNDDNRTPDDDDDWSDSPNDRPAA